ncbi:MAG: prolipoprotein diacylglyceryl transferase [Archangium sp.]|nr:prolipoprotein diacylglyceryl transferase [Archangium sp.]
MSPAFNPGYATFVGLGLVMGYLAKSMEERRLAILPSGQRRWVTAGALLGAIVGAKLGLLLYLPFDAWWQSIRALLLEEWGGRTIIGALFGGFLGVEVAKKALGITVATGDPYAIGLPLGQALGRVGCFIGGCCYGRPLDEASPLRSLSLVSHPAQLYEGALDLAVAVTLFAIRKQPRAPGLLFRYYLLSYAAIRFVMDFFRGDEKQLLGPLSYAQWFCLACAVALSFDVARRRRA